MDRRVLFRCAVFLAIALIAGAGLCLFDFHKAQTAGVDLCLVPLVAASGTVLPLLLASTDRLVPVRVWAGALTPIDPGAPPPKL